MSHSMIVAPRSRKDIRKLARVIRQSLTDFTGGSWREAHFPIVQFLDPLITRIFDRYEDLVVEVVDASVLGEAHGNTYPDQNIIQLRDDVYEGARNGLGRDRLTLAHELGHLLMHRGVSMARALPKREVPAYQSSEWQANCFAGELLVDPRHIEPGDNAFTVADKFGVSTEAAQYQMKCYRKDKLIA